MSLELDYLSELSATKRQLSHQEDDISKFYFFVKNNWNVFEMWSGFVKQLQRIFSSGKPQELHRFQLDKFYLHQSFIKFDF